MKRLAWSIGSALALACGRPPEDITISGRVLGHDGKPLRAAYVGLQGMGKRLRPNVDAKGRFEATLDRPGAYYIWIAGVHHQTVLRPLLVEGPGDVRFQATLAPLEQVATLDSVFVIGDFNGFSTREGRRPMARRSDGTFEVTVPSDADTLVYQILGVEAGGDPISGTSAEHFVRRPGAMLVAGRESVFAAVLVAGAGSTRITFDPGALPQPGGHAAVRFAKPASRAARLSAAYEDVQTRQRRFSDALQAALAAGTDPRAFVYDGSADLAQVRERIASEPDSVLRQYALLQYFSDLQPTAADSLLARRVYDEIAPASILWSFQWGRPDNVIHTIARIAGEPQATQAYHRRVIDASPDGNIRAAFLYSELVRAFRRKKSQESSKPGESAAVAEAEFTSLYARLMTEFGDTHYAKEARSQMAPDRGLLPGRTIPDFALPSLEDSTQVLSPRAFRGQVCLIDFWAVWCGPCVTEMPNLHAAYDKFEKRGFTILSISFDRDPSDVAAFRRDKWRMPWQHALAQGGFQSDIAEQLGIVGIPTAILIDEKGTILDANVRGNALERALTEHYSETLGRRSEAPP